LPLLRNLCAAPEARGPSSSNKVCFGRLDFGWVGAWAWGASAGLGVALCQTADDVRDEDMLMEWTAQVERFATFATLAAGSDADAVGLEWKLPPMDDATRRHVHIQAEKAGLQHSSVGKPDNRQIVLRRKMPEFCFPAHCRSSSASQLDPNGTLKVVVNSDISQHFWHFI
jgi:hypothetical protein